MGWFSFDWTSTIVVSVLIDLNNTSGWTWLEHQFLTIEVYAIACLDRHSSIVVIIELKLYSRSEAYPIAGAARWARCRATLVTLVIVANVPALLVIFPYIHIILVASLCTIITICNSCYLLLLLHILILMESVYNSGQMLGKGRAITFRLGLCGSLNVLRLMCLSCCAMV